MSTKTLENLYAQLTPAELFRLIMAGVEFLVLVEETARFDDALER